MNIALFIANAYGRMQYSEIYNQRQTYFHLLPNIAKFFSSSNLINDLFNHKQMNSNFKTILDKTVMLNSNFTVYTEKEIITTLTATIKDSKFARLNDIEGSGGAIYATSPLILENILFERCSAHQGGAISSTNNLDIRFTTFQYCSAKYSKGDIEIISKSTTDMFISSCVFFHSKAEYHGSICRISNGNFNQTNCNASHIRAIQCVGFAEIQDGTAFVSNSLFLNCSAHAHHGCLVLLKNTNVNVNQSLFYKCVQGSTITTTSAAITIDNTLQIPKIEFCKFTSCSAASGRTVNGVGYITCANCNFSGTQENELPGNVHCENCLFNKLSMVRKMNDIGFKNISTSYEKIEKNEMNFIKIVIQSIISAIITSALCVIVHKQVVHMIHKSKVSKGTTVV